MSRFPIPVMPHSTDGTSCFIYSTKLIPKFSLCIYLILFTIDRMNAARSRNRTKQQIEDLSSEVDQYAARNIQLQRLNAELVRQVESLTQENNLLRQRLSLGQGAASITSGSLTAVAASASSHHPLQQHQALLQSLSMAPPTHHSIGTAGMTNTRSLIPGAQEPLISTSSLANLLAQRDSFEQQRLLFSLGQQQQQHQQQPPNHYAGSSLNSLMNQLTPAQRLLLSDDQLRLVGGAGGGTVSDSANDLQSQLLQALLNQQQQQEQHRDRDSSHGPSI
jgi:hypothetical protein